MFLNLGVKMNEIGRTCSKCVQNNELIRSFDWKILSKRITCDTRHGWENNIKTEVEEVGCENRKWNEVTQRTYVNTTMKLRVP
jgi:hypothetical protein